MTGPVGDLVFKRTRFHRKIARARYSSLGLQEGIVSIEFQIKTACGRRVDVMKSIYCEILITRLPQLLFKVD
jgi:hypothetical protein